MSRLVKEELLPNGVERGYEMTLDEFYALHPEMRPSFTAIPYELWIEIFRMPAPKRRLKVRP